MKIDSRKGSDTPIFKLEENDSSRILDLRRLLAGKYVCSHCGQENENYAWKILQGYFSSLRLWIEEMGKSHAQSRTKNVLCGNDFSILTGLDLAIGMPEKLIAQSDMLDKITKQRRDEESKDDEPTEYGD